MARLPTPEVLREILRYEPESGKLYWLPRRIDLCKNERAMNSFNAQFAGKEAFTADNGDGYLCSHLTGRTLRAHRVAWAIFHGRWPANQIDHINGNRKDNRICNLRETTNAQNQRNRRPRQGCTSRYKGVGYVPKLEKWQARITDTRGKRVNLGFYKTEEEAHSAYARASEKHHGPFGRVR